MGCLLLVSLYLDYSCRCQSKNDRKWGRAVNRALGLEMLLEDIPQFVLTALISAERRSLTPYAVFNLSTSSFNFVLNLLDMIEIQEGEDTTVQNQDDNGDGGEAASEAKYAVTSAGRPTLD
eukprot:CAMPEP_0119004748 /NCGR_PEP_ID=MMETSP1176-20130426/1330_1 /TAXON_ID=265551 /ORGANISM="Synedropsis recta cf, Strain CCMP1620" /LENGTH=120 /DNA_ID=CAMNT_0006956493 /DNA_START=260 /DNA_END=622 /DNA_ORIENTATION=+